MMEQMFPRIDWQLVTFGFPIFPDDQMQNSYILSLLQQHHNIFPVLMITATTNNRYLKDELTTNSVGLKMYPTARQKKKPTSVIEVFPREALAIADQLSKPLIVHLPNGIVKNYNEVLRLAGLYPGAKFVIAHMGNVFCYNHKFKEILGSLEDQSNIFLDTAMVADPMVISEAIDVLGPTRVLFGSDAPFSYTRGGYARNSCGKIRLYSQYKFSWVKDEEYQSYRHLFTLTHLKIILAIKEAIAQQNTGKSRQIKELIFHQNTERLFKLGPKHQRRS